MKLLMILIDLLNCFIPYLIQQNWRKILNKQHIQLNLNIFDDSFLLLSVWLSSKIIINWFIYHNGFFLHLCSHFNKVLFIQLNSFNFWRVSTVFLSSYSLIQFQWMNSFKTNCISLLFHSHNVSVWMKFFSYVALLLVW